jgi:hypothetical protein
MLTAGGWLTITDLDPEKWDKTKKQGPSKQAQWKTQFKSKTAGGLQKLMPEHTNLNCQTSLRDELTKQLPLKDRRKRNKEIHYPTTWWDHDRASAKTPIGLDAGGVTPELRLRLKFNSSWTWRFLFVCLFCFLFVHVCLFTLPNDLFGVFLLLLVLLLWIS